MHQKIREAIKIIKAIETQPPEDRLRLFPKPHWKWTNLQLKGKILDIEKTRGMSSMNTPESHTYRNGLLQDSSIFFGEEKNPDQLLESVRRYAERDRNVTQVNLKASKPSPTIDLDKLKRLLGIRLTVKRNLNEFSEATTTNILIGDKIVAWLNTGKGEKTPTITSFHIEDDTHIDKVLGPLTKAIINPKN